MLITKAIFMTLFDLFKKSIFESVLILTLLFGALFIVTGGNSKIGSSELLLIGVIVGGSFLMTLVNALRK